MYEINNLYRIKQKLSVSGYRFMPFYSEEWKAYLMETSEYYIEMYRELQKVPANWKMTINESRFWMAAVDCMMSNLKQTLFTESARGVVRRLSVEKLDILESNIDALEEPPVQLGRILNYWLLWRGVRNIWANSEVVYYHVAGGWPKVKESDSEWKNFVRDIEKLGQKIQETRNNDPIGELRTWVDKRIRKSEDESVYREIMLGHRKIEPDVRLIENILQMVARVLENRPEDVKRESMGFDQDVFADAFLKWLEMFYKIGNVLPRIRAPHHGSFWPAIKWKWYGSLFFKSTARLWNKIEGIIHPEIMDAALHCPVQKYKADRQSSEIYAIKKDVLFPFLGDVDTYFMQVREYNKNLKQFYAQVIQENDSGLDDNAKSSSNGKDDADYFLRGPWNICNFLKHADFEEMKLLASLCLAQDDVKESECYLGITRAGYIIAALLGWISGKPVACAAVNPVPHVGQSGYSLPSSILLIDESFRTGYTQNLLFEYLRKKSKSDIHLFTLTNYKNWGYPTDRLLPLSFLEIPMGLEDHNKNLKSEDMISLNPLCKTAAQDMNIEARLDALPGMDISKLTEELKAAAIINVQSSKNARRRVEKYDITRITLFPDLHMRLAAWMATKVREELMTCNTSNLGIFLGSEYAVAYAGLFALIWKYWQKKGDYGKLPDVEWSPPVRGLQETAVFSNDGLSVFMDISYDTGRVYGERKARIMEKVKNMAKQNIFDLIVVPFADKKEIGKIPNSCFLVELNCE